MLKKAKIPVSIHTIRVRLPRNSVQKYGRFSLFLSMFQVFCIAMGVFLSGVAGGTIAVLLMFFLGDLGFQMPAPAIMAICVLSFGVSLTLGSKLIGKYTYCLHMKQAAWRVNRLKQVASRADAAKRIPKRLVELDLRTCIEKSATAAVTIGAVTAETLSSCPAGSIFLVNPRGPFVETDGCLPDIPFEPVNFKDVERLNQAEQTYIDALEGTPAVTIKNEDTAKTNEGKNKDINYNEIRLPPVRPFLGKLLGIGCSLFLNILVLACVFAVILSVVLYFCDAGTYSCWYPVGLATLFVVICGTGVLYGEDYWLVPGGVVIREHFFWGKEDTVKFASRIDSPLVIEDYKATMLAGGEIMIPPIASRYILMAWMNSARTPTLSEVRAFCGLNENA